MKSCLTGARISPKKLRVVAEVVREMDVARALDTLRFMPKKGAAFLHKAIASAAANAVHNDTQELASLRIGTLSVTKGSDLKRMNPVSRGRGRTILKRTSNIRVELALK